MYLPTALWSLIASTFPRFPSTPLPSLSLSQLQPPSPQLVLTDAIHKEEASIHAENGFRVPTRNESTVLARRLLAKSRAGTLATTFPKNISSVYPPYSHVPASVHDTPIGLPEYIASCEEPSGNPTILALTISTSTRNAVAGSNVSLSISWWDEYVKLTGADPWSAANLPRASLVGWLEEIPQDEVKSQDIVSCFTSTHSDSKWWLPGDDHAAHRGIWMRMVVEEIYWIGGFGDRAFIGWFEPEVWRAVTEEDWMAVRLPGEKA